MKEEIEKILKLQKNLLITGDILSGKTTKILWPILDNIINNKEDFIVLDSKGEYLNNYYDKLDNYHKIIINLHDLTKSEGINFFDIPYEFYLVWRYRAFPRRFRHCLKFAQKRPANF